jgi:hypothetical protein
MLRTLRFHFVLICAIGFPVSSYAQTEFAFGPLQHLLTNRGPMSFGTVVSADVVSWSRSDAQDLLIARLWDGG